MQHVSSLLPGVQASAASTTTDAAMSPLKAMQSMIAADAAMTAGESLRRQVVGSPCCAAGRVRVCGSDWPANERSEPPHSELVCTSIDGGR